MVPSTRKVIDLFFVLGQKAMDVVHSKLRIIIFSGNKLAQNPIGGFSDVDIGFIIYAGCIGAIVTGEVTL